MRVLVGGGSSATDRQDFYHAALAAGVSSWDAYINGIVREFYVIVAQPVEPTYTALHGITAQAAERALEKFNTPNWENTRTLLSQMTGYDPINDWNWPAGGMNRQQSQTYLNEILKVRHSFAHGLPLPAYGWTQSSSGAKRLTRAGVDDVGRFLRHMVLVTDEGLKQRIVSAFGTTPPW